MKNLERTVKARKVLLRLTDSSAVFSQEVHKNLIENCPHILLGVLSTFQRLYEKRGGEQFSVSKYKLIASSNFVSLSLRKSQLSPFSRLAIINHKLSNNIFLLIIDIHIRNNNY